LYTWLQTPQKPVAQTVAWNKFHMDQFPTGTNAIVAVLAYTGYDMEDAMIMNKSSMERGLCHGQVYKVWPFLDL
jgi:DNA-directed RNA polymerase I subunit RPA2